MEKKIRQHITKILDNPTIDAYFCHRTGIKTISVFIHPELEAKAQKLIQVLRAYHIGYIVQDLIYGRQLLLYLRQKP